MNIIDKAKYFSIGAHEAIGQKRKYTGEPYWYHPCAVAELVAGVTDDQNMIAAAWLHDVVEDTRINSLTIRSVFGVDILYLVMGMTDVSSRDDGNRAKRKEIDRAHTARQSKYVHTIKLADLIHNSFSIEKYDAKFAKIYMNEKSLLLNVLQDGDKTLYKQALNIVEEYYAKDADQQIKPKG